MTGDEKCPKCGTALSGNALGGLCPKCLGWLAFGFLSSKHADASERLSSLRRVGDYEILAEIARGGMGVVYKARQIRLNRLVALKMVLHGPFSSEEFVQRFKTEAQAAAGLHHPNIVGIYEVGEEDGHHFFSMEYIEGTNLADLAREKPLNVTRAARLLKTIAEAVHYAHDRGILHRDLKPSNLLVDPLDQPHITDFGLAMVIQSQTELTTTGQALGSPGYMAPEQALGKHDRLGPFTDVYSLGAILYHLLTGRPPFQGETLPEILLQVQNSEPVAPQRLNPSIPANLQTICLKCLQKEPSKRYGTAGDLAEDLNRFLLNKPIQARPISVFEKLFLWCRRHPVPASLTGALVVVVLLGLAGIIWQWGRAELHARGEAEQRKIAEAYGRKITLNLYAADLNVASQAVQRGDYGLARRTLAGLLPKLGEADLRGFEWHYLWNHCRGDQLAVLTGHAWIVTCCAFSRDGKLLVTGSQDGTAKLWDVPNRQLLHSFNVSSGAVWSAGFSPESDLVMASGSDDEVKFWGTEDRRLVARIPGQIACLSPSGSLVAISHSSPFFWERSGFLEIWDYRKGVRLKEIPSKGRAIALSPDGLKLASAGPSKNIDLWDLASGKKMRVIETAQPVWSIAFSPDSGKLLATDWSSEASLWVLDEAAVPRKIKGHDLTVWSAIFSPDGEQIATTGSDQTIRLWNSSTLEAAGIFHGHGNEVWCAAFTLDGRVLASGGKDQAVMLWPGKPKAKRAILPLSTGYRPIFTADGSKVVLVTKSETSKQSRLWEVATQAQLQDLGEKNVVGFTPDGGSVVLLGAESGSLEFCSPRASEPAELKLDQVQASDKPFGFVGFSRDYRDFFSIDASGTIRVWNAENGKLLWSLQGPTPPIRAAELATGGRSLAISLERENSVRIYKVDRNQPLELIGHRDFIGSLSFSPDLKTLATGSMDGTIKIWDTSTGRQVFSLPGHMQEATDVSFSPDGKTLASVGRRESVKLWHLETQRELLSIDMPKAGTFIEFTGDGRHLAVTTEEGSIQFFDAEAPKPELTSP
jgi:WD40 repeat protein/tRNA A-37 threonylcarbamoyl transferase component Bud32